MVDANTPLFNRPPGWLKTLQNMRVKPGGWLEARGGQETLRPSGGSSAAVGSAGQVGGVHEHSRQQGAVFMFDPGSGLFSADIGNLYYFPLMAAAAADMVSLTPIIDTRVVDSAIYFGSTDKYSFLRFNLGQGCGVGSTYLITWEYRTNGGTWQPLSSTVPVDFKVASGIQTMQWLVPNDWAAYSVNNQFMYWVRCRISTAGVVAAVASVCQEKIRSNWVGRRNILAGLVGVSKGLGARNDLYVNGETTGGAEIYTVYTAAGIGAVQSTDRDRIRMVTYQDRVIITDGTASAKLNMNFNTSSSSSQPLGFAKPDATPTLAAGVAVPNFGQACVFAYGISYGWGPNGEWGESQVVKSATANFAANQRCTVTFGILSGPPVSGMVDVIYVYRTNDLTGVPASAQNDQPMYRIAAVTRTTGVTVTFPATYTDSTYAIPFPYKSAIQASNLPPSRFKLIAVLKNFLFIGGSDEFPSRVYWSDGSYGEAFDLDVTTSSRFADFAWAGPEVVAMAPAFDAMYCWTEDRMFGIADPDEDFPNVFEVESGRGCTAPDSVCTAFGYLIWQSKDGFYAMDQNRVVTRITNDHAAVFGRMSRLTHGGTRAVIQDGLYEVQLATPDGTAVAGDSRWRFDLVKPSWSKSTVVRAPMTVVQAPLGHADQGVMHPIYANMDPAVSDRFLYVGEYTTTDSGTGYDCIADIHFGPGKFQKFSPRRFAAYYQADSGWGTPVISNAGGTYIYKTVSSFGTVSPKSGSDYKVAIANATERVSGSQDIVIRFKATTVVGGAVRGQRLIAAYLDGRLQPVHTTS